MPKLTGKKQMPLQTRIAATVAVVTASVYLILFAINLISDPASILTRRGLFYALVLGYAFIVYGLVRKPNAGWYAGLAVFGLAGLVFTRTIFGSGSAEIHVLFLSALCAAFIAFYRGNVNFSKAQPEKGATIPAGISVVATFAGISAIWNAAIFLLLVIYGFEGDLVGTIRNFWIILALITGYVFVTRGLTGARKSGWYAGLALFCVVIGLLIGMATATLGENEYFDFRGAYAFFAIINIPFPILLLIDRKKYFAAIDRKKKTEK